MIEMTNFFFDEKLKEEFVNYLLDEGFEIIQGYKFLNKNSGGNLYKKFMLRNNILKNNVLYKKEYGKLDKTKEKLLITKGLNNLSYYIKIVENIISKIKYNRCFYNGAFDYIYSDTYNPVIKLILPLYKDWTGCVYRGCIINCSTYIDKNKKEVKKPDICSKDFEKIKKWIEEHTVKIEKNVGNKSKEYIIEDYVSKYIIKYYDEKEVDFIRIAEYKSLY